MIKTKIDDMIRLLKDKKRLTIDEIARELLLDGKSVEKIAQILDKAEVVKLVYPINVVARPWVEIKEIKREEQLAEPTGNLIDEYNISGLKGHASGNVKIVLTDLDKRPMYFISAPQVSYATRAYFDAIKDEISKLTPIEQREIVREDIERGFDIRHKVIASVLQQDIAPEKKVLDVMCGIILREMYGLGEIEILIADDLLEEVIINSSHQPIAVYHRKYGWLKTNIQLKTEEEVENYASQIARKIGKQISLLNPILDAHLISGDRVNSTLFPISTVGNTLTLRLFARNPWTIVGFLDKENRVLTVEMAALLWQAVHYEMNVLISGGTASGKTSALNAIVSLVPNFQRVISIEDTRELALPSYQWNWIPLVTRPANPEGLGEITMLDLVVNALRMRPDRIVMGEIRRKREAEVLFEAMHTGHSVYATMHADTGSQVIKRLIEPPIEVPASQVEDVHLIMVQYRDRRKNIRKTLEISEVALGPSGPELNHIYNWRPRVDQFQLVRPPRRYIEQMNLHTGMTEKEINEDQEEKKSILNWMYEQRLHQIEDVGAIMKIYYSDKDSLLKAVEKKLSPTKVI